MLNNKIRSIFICFFFLFISVIISQPRAKYRPFDWLNFRESGKINALSEGYQFLYIATENGGINRYHLYANQYDFPITTAQGLKSNEIFSVHFDHNTGILWAATDGFLQFSFTREGNWMNISLRDIGLRDNDNLVKIGSSENYLWAKASSVYVKMDRSSGTLAGIFPVPDELNIRWSSGEYSQELEVKNIVENYTLMSGWMLSGTKIIDSYGRYINITTGLIGKYNDSWVGCSDGTLFQGNMSMETLFPTEFGIRGSDISAIILDNNENLWVGSKDYSLSRGVSRINISNFQTDHYDFDVTINMDLTATHSLYSIDNEMWIGGNGVMLFYDKEDNYWRTIGEERGVPNSDITSIVGDSSYIWVGSKVGIRRIDRYTKREDAMGFEYLFYNHPIFDLHINNMGVWMATRTGIYLYDKNNPQIMDALLLGQSYLDFPLSMITAIYEKGENIYFATNIGIVIYNSNENVWDMVISSSEYKGYRVNDLSVIKNFCFIATEKGLFRINLKSHHIKEYNYGFIGSVNSIILKDKFIWLGTSEGLFRFKWRKDI